MRSWTSTEGTSNKPSTTDVPAARAAAPVKRSPIAAATSASGQTSTPSRKMWTTLSASDASRPSATVWYACSQTTVTTAIRVAREIAPGGRTC